LVNETKAYRAMTEHLITLAKQILDINPFALVSGSLALNVQGIRTLREPTDLDIWMPIDYEFCPIEGMELYDGARWYRELHHRRLAFCIGDRDDMLRIDIFKPISTDYPRPERTVAQGLDMISAIDILKFKLEHAFDKSNPDHKHLEDLLFILQNIQTSKSPNQN
jgi:hypothetical protein